MHPLLFVLQLHAFIIFFFFFNDTATTEIYTLSLHDALPIYSDPADTYNAVAAFDDISGVVDQLGLTSLVLVGLSMGDRKSTRLNSSHSQISYAVFCLKKKKHYRGRERWYDPSCKAQTLWRAC